MLKADNRCLESSDVDTSGDDLNAYSRASKRQHRSIDHLSTLVEFRAFVHSRRGQFYVRAQLHSGSRF
jgi:hypothetical protein